MGSLPVTACRAGEAIQARQIGVVELTAALLERIGQLEPLCGAFAFQNPHALEEAAALDAFLAKQPKDVVLPPLFGVPFGIKENMAATGLPTACGCRLLLDNVASGDSAALRKLRRQGVFLGTLNMDELAMGSSTATSCHHLTRNPLNLARSPGGSSGGPAAAVAAGEVFYSLGSDTGGSIRQPAAFCGVVGLKPTFGLVDSAGVVPMAPSLDAVGPLTRDVADCAAVLGVLTGENYSSTLTAGVKGLRIGLPREYWQAGISAEILAQCSKAVAALQGGGAVISEVSLPTSEYGLAAYHVIAPTELFFALQRLGEDLTPQQRSEGLGAEAKRRFLNGAYFAQGLGHELYYEKACRVRCMMTAEFTAAFHQFDVLLTPTTRQIAFPLAAAPADPVEMYLNDLLLAPVNLAGLCSISIPYGQVDGMINGIQLIGPKMGEALLFQIGRFLENN